MNPTEQWEVLLEDTSDIEIHIDSLCKTGDLEAETVLGWKGLKAGEIIAPPGFQIETIFICDERTCKFIF